jgi:creatinine amidohydrolase
MRWVELNSPRLGSVSRETICVLPLGATEQHGPHLPLATDQIIADGLAARLDALCGGKLLVMPSLPATCSEHHMAFPGSLTLNHATFIKVVAQIICSAARHGFRRFFLLNAHGGNIAVGGVVAEQLSILQPDIDVVFGTWFRMAGERLRHLVEGSYPAVGHACEFETSLIMALRPELVDSEAIIDDGVAPTSPLLKFDLLAGGPTVRSVSFDRFTTSGVWGKPSFATPAKGEAILDVVVPLMRSVLHAHWTDGPGLTDAGQTDRQRRAVSNAGGAQQMEREVIA